MEIRGLSPAQLSQYIDHTLLRPEAAESEVAKLCEEAVRYGFKTVCVESKWLPKVITWLKGSKVLPITVVSFPSGEGSVEGKCQETRDAIVAGAKEIDMVLWRKYLHAKEYRKTLDEVSAVVKTAGEIPVKVILEMSELSTEEKIAACVLCQIAGAAFVKTSTGFSKSGAVKEDVQLMRRIVGDKMGVKASGGIKNYAAALEMIKAGADRLGTSSSVAIVEEAR